MAYDQKEFLDLLQEYKSDETKKARRNVSAISFAILAAWILGIRLADIRFFGLDMSKTAELPVLALAAVLLIYWTIMFVASWKHDQEIQKERTWFLNNEIARLRKRLADIENLEKQYPGHGALPDRGEVTVFLTLYDAQRSRTERATKLGQIIGQLELYVPLALSGGAAIVLIVASIFAIR